MNNKLKLIIADDEPWICKLLSQIIDFESLSIELIAMVYDGEQLLNLINEQEPDIVITDICMPKLEGLEVIRRVRNSGSKCCFVIITGYRQFEYAYEALKYDVGDYILKPVDEKELNETLKKIADNLNQEKSGELPGGNNSSIRAYLLNRAIHQISEEKITLEEINRLYSTNFREGMFRVILVKLDYYNDVHVINEEVSSILKKISEIILKQYEEFCADIVIQNKDVGVMALLNYQPKHDDEIIDRFNDLLEQVKNITNIFKGLNATLCVGGAVNDPYQIVTSKNQVFKAEWCRMAIGANKVIFGEEKREKMINLEGKLKELDAKIKRAFEILDTDSFKAGMEEFFSFPVQLLCSYEAMMFAYRVKDMYFEINEDLISDYTDPDALILEITKTLHLSVTFEKYKRVFLDSFISSMKQITENIDKQNTMPIRKAFAYVEENYGKRINLEDVAKVVNLNPVYFSRLFKSETGKNFTEYVTEYRIKIARELLKSSDKNISEIAYELGYNDSRYFSRLFKKAVGVKPTEYRKIYG